MNYQLKQARDGFQKFIDDDKQEFSVSIPADSSNPWSVPTTEKFYGRLAHERGIVAADAGTTAGMSTHLQKFLSFPHTVTFLAVGQEITGSDGLVWRLSGSPDPLRRFGGIYGYQVPLTEVTT